MLKSDLDSRNPPIGSAIIRSDIERGRFPRRASFPRKPTAFLFFYFCSSLARPLISDSNSPSRLINTTADGHTSFRGFFDNSLTGFDNDFFHRFFIFGMTRCCFIDSAVAQMEWTSLFRTQNLLICHVSPGSTDEGATERLDTFAILRILRGNDFHATHVVPPGFYRVLPGFTEFYRVWTAFQTPWNVYDCDIFIELTLGRNR